MKKHVITVGLSALLLAAGTGLASAGPQLNRCWGKIASQTAQLETYEGNGGAMGKHARSTKAADKNGGFANSNNAFGITFNTKNEDGNHGREGVGNVSKGAPHNAHPGAGGNGQHAINNSSMIGDNVKLDLDRDGVVDSNVGLTNVLDPVNGQLVGAGGHAYNLHCDIP